MKYRHQRVVAFQVIRHVNSLVRLFDGIFYYLSGLEPNTSTPTTLTLDQIKTQIKLWMETTSLEIPKIGAFITSYPDAGYLENVGRDALTLNANLVEIKTDVDIVNDSILSIRNAVQLENLSSEITNHVLPLSVTEYRHTEIFKANAINDFLDASYYTLLGLYEHNGQPHGLTEDGIRKKVESYLRQIPNFQTAWSDAVKEDVASMVSVADYVQAHLNIVPFADLADYIGVNVEKLPLYRRIWA